MMNAQFLSRPNTRATRVLAGAIGCYALAIGLLASTTAPANAHPEMDRCGRDISSGPVQGECPPHLTEFDVKTDTVGIAAAPEPEPTAPAQ